MKRKWKYCLAVSAVMICLLLVLALLTVEPAAAEPSDPPSGEDDPETVTLLPSGEVDGSYTIRVLQGETVTEMTMSEYLKGVVRAEMPASFEQEALCAQAVAARTYTLYKMDQGSHAGGADICTDAACCQAWQEREPALAVWGSAGERNEAKIANAVAATDGQILVYGGEPILAVFHAASAGQTCGAGAVWSGDLPYLQSVSSPEDDGAVPNYYSRVEIPNAQFRETFLAAHPEADLSGDPKEWIGEPVTAADGVRVDTVTVGGVTVRGVEIRRLYGLRSAAFETEISGGKVVFYVTGYGHGVGMSQYGANEMALDGAAWREILLHYYTGVSIEVRSR